MKHPHPDPTVTIVAWSGPLSALVARLRVPPTAIRREARPEGKGLVLDVESPTIWPRVRLRLQGGDE